MKEVTNMKLKNGLISIIGLAVLIILLVVALGKHFTPQTDANCGWGTAAESVAALGARHNNFRFDDFLCDMFDYIYGNRSSVEPSEYDDYIVKEDGVRDNYLHYVNRAWNKKVPVWLKKMFVEDGWKIIISAEPVSARFELKGAVGVALLNKKTIYLDNNHLEYEKTLLHELGHYIDWHYGNISLSDEFGEIFEAENGQYDKEHLNNGDYAISSEREYFAYAFFDIISGNPEFLANTPETYAFVEQYSRK